MNNTSKKTTIVIAVVSICILSYLVIHNILSKRPRGSQDILSFYNQINQAIYKGNDWKQYVENSNFQLGEFFEHDERLFQRYGTYPKLDGSTVVFAMFHEFAWQHLGMSKEQSDEFIYLNMTHEAYMSLVNGKITFSTSYENNGEYISLEEYKQTDLIVVTHPSDEELAYATNLGIELIIEPVCFDAFVFITHVDNPVDSLTIEQVQKIYTGKIKNWKDVGGNDEKIVAYQRQTYSGSQTGMEQMVMQGLKMETPKLARVIEGMGELIDVVAEYENESYSIGYTYLYYINNLYKNPKIKVLSIEGAEPTDDNIRNGSYPFSMNYYAIIKAENKENVGGKFLDWMLSEVGQQCIEQAGYIPLNPDKNIQNK